MAEAAFTANRLDVLVLTAGLRRRCIGNAATAESSLLVNRWGVGFERGI